MRRFCNDLPEVHLAMLKRQGLIETWHDRRISAGKNLGSSIDENLNTASVILCLVSPDFIASEYCYSLEMQRALERNAKGEARVIPVILRYCEWEQTPLGALRGTPRDNKPVAAWADKDEALNDVAKDIRAALVEMGCATRKSRLDRMRATPPPPRRNLGATIMASLQVKKTFTDLEKDRFIEESFEFIAEYIANSLKELKTKGIQRLILGFNVWTQTDFVAALYQEGKEAICAEAVFRGGVRGFGSAISFNTSDAGETDTMSGGFSLRENESSLGFSGSPFAASLVRRDEHVDRLQHRRGVVEYHH